MSSSELDHSIDDAVGGVLHRGRWLVIAAYLCARSADEGKAVEYLNEARSLVKHFGASRLMFELGFASADHYMKAQDLTRAADELSELHQMAIKAAPAQRAEYAKLMTRLLLLQGRAAEGLRWAEEAMTIAPAAGFNGANLRAFEMELVYALAANDRLSDALTSFAGWKWSLANYAPLSNVAYVIYWRAKPTLGRCGKV